MSTWEGLEAALVELDAVLPPAWEFGGVKRTSNPLPYLRWSAWAQGPRESRIVTDGQPTPADAVAGLRDRIAAEFHREGPA